MTGPEPVFPDGVTHVGITVRDLDRSLTFWEGLLGTTADRYVGDAEYLGRIVGYPGFRIHLAYLPVPGGPLLELLAYQDRDDPPIGEETAQPGNTHLCLRVPDIDAAWRRAVALGARPRSDGPVLITAGRNRGSRAAYLRTPDGVTIELVQPPG